MADEPDNPDDGEIVSVTTENGTDNADNGGDVDESDGGGTESVPPPSLWRDRLSRRRLTHVGSALVAGSVIVAALTALAGWFGYHAFQKHEEQARRDSFVRTARQAAVNLTTINYTEAEADVQRILDGATGAFRDDFEQRSKPFIDVVKAAQSKSEGTVTDAGLESQRGDAAQVLVAVAVKSRTAGGEEAPREWRMRIEVRSVAGDPKVSNVVFVP
ncbi:MULTISPECIES: Mce protein [unclassified Mycobacterium]|uniref:Mce protein n=1 Tax=unclassified Mycobacterium TaxID=2642494 RepID=UPI000800896B|nr:MULTISPECIES: Mce protein [unclassified Mycobacterium]OBH04581.1 Mce protein [Mycobacterium sp. E2699]OBI54163.1 Mce protein [Mycobacterium sp. E787]